jgi:predicted HAD superfamily Cof-like phosphohydrolase
MLKSEHQTRVEECMRKGGQTVRNVPTMPTDPKERIRIVKLVIEEGLELARSMGVCVVANHEVLALAPDGLEITDVEYGDAGQDKTDLTEAADALGDLSVVTYGGFGALGIVAEPLLKLIDENNLSKFDPPACPDCSAVMEKRLVTLKAKNGSELLGVKHGDRIGEMLLWVCPKGGTEHQVREENEGPWIREDGKYMKPPYWKPPDVKGVLEQQSKQETLDPDAAATTVTSNPLKWAKTEYGMTDAARDEYCERLKFRFWKTLPWRERATVLRNVVGIKGPFPTEQMPQTVEGEIIKVIRRDGYLTTFEREIDLAEQRVAKAGDFEVLRRRFFELTTEARYAFWREEGVSLKDAVIPIIVQEKMLLQYRFEPDRTILRQYLDRVAPLRPEKKAGSPADPGKAVDK